MSDLWIAAFLAETPNDPQQGAQANPAVPNLGFPSAFPAASIYLYLCMMLKRMMHEERDSPILRTFTFPRLVSLSFVDVVKFAAAPETQQKKKEPRALDPPGLTFS